MSQNNAQRSLPYDHAAVVARQAIQLGVNSAGSGSISSTKFTAWALLQVYGATFATVAAGTSTYTVAGTATNPATQVSAIYIFNTSTTNTVALATQTIGPFTIGGTTTAGANVSVGGIGGVAGGYQGPYSLNTLGGTNTAQVWGTTTYVTGTASVANQVSQGYPGAPGAGFGGFPMNPGDQLYFVNGTDATATWVASIQYGLQPVNGNVLA